MGEEFITVEEGERSTVLDAMALLGGNEYLVQQMVEASVGPNYLNYSNIQNIHSL